MDSPSALQSGVETLSVLELGTNSLKLHLYSPDLERYEPFRVEWEVGFEVYSTRVFSEETIRNTVEQVRKLLDRCQIGAPDDLFGIATGVFKDALNTPHLLEHLDRELSIPVRVLTEMEQARLMLLGFRDRVKERPALAFDLGCGSLEMVYLGGGQKYLHEALNLGVIRIQHIASFGSGEWDEAAAVRYIGEELRHAKRIQLESVHGTGGTVRAIAQVAGVSEVTVETLERVEAETRANGPPQFLSPRRQAIFLPGVIVVKHLCEHVGASALHHHKVDLGVVLMDRLREFHRALGGKLRRAFIDREIDIFNW